MVFRNNKTPSKKTLTLRSHVFHFEPESEPPKRLLTTLYYQKMIESCPKKRMLIGITLLGALTVLVLIVESHWTDQKNPTRKPQFLVEQNSTCWEKEHFDVVKECEPCTAFEITSRSIGVCIHTHYKEVLRCDSGETVTRSCDKAAYYDEKAFWRFEGLMLLASTVATLAVIARKRVLNQRVLSRVARQLANSV